MTPTAIHAYETFFFFWFKPPDFRRLHWPQLIRIRGVVTIKTFYPSQIVCLVKIESESSSHLPSLHRQLSHNRLVILMKLLQT